MASPEDARSDIGDPAAPPHAVAQSGLAHTASRSAGASLAGQAIRLVVQTAGIVILARLLTPADYGVLALAVAVSGLGELVRDFGLANASVQARTVSTAQRSNLFWLNTAIGATLGITLAAAAPALARSLDQPKLAPVLAALALGFLMNGLSTQWRASLVRGMRFLALNISDTIALIVGTGLGILLAAHGAGYWALVLMLLAQNLSSLVAAGVLARWMPGPPNRSGPVGDFLRFGFGLFGSQVLNYATKNASTFVIGLTLGVTQLGFYNRAYQLLNLPLAQLQAPATQVALPTLSRLQDDAAAFDRFLLRGQSMLLQVTTAILAVSGAQAYVLFHIILGERWMGAAPIFQLLALSGLTMVANYATYWVFLAKGLTRSYLYLSLATQGATICAILLGSLGGLIGIVSAFAVVNALIWPSTLIWLRRVSDAPVGHMFQNAARILAVYGSAGLASLASTALPLSNRALQLGFGVSVFLLVLTILYLLIKPYRRDVHEASRIVRLMLRRPR